MGRWLMLEDRSAAPVATSEGDGTHDPKVDRVIVLCLLYPDLQLGQVEALEGLLSGLAKMEKEGR